MVALLLEPLVLAMCILLNVWDEKQEQEQGQP